MPSSINSVVRLGITLALLGLTRVPAFADAPEMMSHEMLARLVRVCAPQVNSTTQAAIVAVESGGLPWVLHDDNDGRVYSPATLESAQSFARELLARNKAVYGAGDRGVDVGLAQINSSNFVSLGVTAADMLDPCANLNASARIITSAYVHERAILARDPSWRGDERALERALQDYNSGRPSGDDAYVRAIFSTLGGTLVREVGSASRVTLIPVSPLPLPNPPRVAPASRVAAQLPNAMFSREASAVRGHGALFYHHDPADPVDKK
jgi:type IV secretion system protein VirB1